MEKDDPCQSFDSPAHEVVNWDDVWFTDRPLPSFCAPDAVPQCQAVHEFWNGHSWDEPKVRANLSSLGIPADIIDGIVGIPIDENGKDEVRWNLTRHGNFTTASAWELTRHRQETVEILE